MNSASDIGRGLFVFDDDDLNVAGNAGERFPKSGLYALAYCRVRTTDIGSPLFVARQRRVYHDKPWVGQTFPLAIPNEGDHESGYRRDHLRALAQRVEVADDEIRIMGSKTDLLRVFSAAQGGKSAVVCVPRRGCPT
jgi:hypothetical protein